MKKAMTITPLALCVVFVFCNGGGGIVPPEEAKCAVEQLPEFTDSRDGKTYRRVKIGSQVWMAENLNYGAEGSKCYGEGGKVIVDIDEADNPIMKVLRDKEIQANCAKYGRLYDWNAAKTACPAGFHLPADAEWTALTDYLGGLKTAGKKLKSTTGWNNNGNGTNDVGFSALPGGDGYGGGNFYDVGNDGYWWSATENGAHGAWIRNMYYDLEIVLRHNYSKTNRFSVRCLED